MSTDRAGAVTKVWGREAVSDVSCSNNSYEKADEVLFLLEKNH